MSLSKNRKRVAFNYLHKQKSWAVGKTCSIISYERNFRSIWMWRWWPNPLRWYVVTVSLLRGWEVIFHPTHPSVFLKMHDTEVHLLSKWHETVSNVCNFPRIREKWNKITWILFSRRHIPSIYSVFLSLCILGRTLATRKIRHTEKMHWQQLFSPKLCCIQTFLPYNHFNEAMAGKPREMQKSNEFDLFELVAIFENHMAFPILESNEHYMIPVKALCVLHTDVHKV